MIVGPILLQLLLQLFLVRPMLPLLDNADNRNIVSARTRAMQSK